MPGFDVTPYQLDGGAAGVADSSATLRAALDALAALVTELLGGSWDGPAASQFARDWDEWEAAARAVLGALETMSLLLRATAASYRAAEIASVQAS